MAGNLEGPVNAGRGTEVAGRGTGADDDYVERGRNPAAGEEIGEMRAVGQKAGRHALGGAPAVLDIVGVHGPRHVRFFVGGSAAAIDGRADIQHAQPVARVRRKPLRGNKRIGHGN